MLIMESGREEAILRSVQIEKSHEEEIIQNCKTIVKRH